MTEINKPKGTFRRYIKWNGRWRHVYVVSTHFQLTITGEKIKTVEFKLSKNSRTVHAAERDRFFTEKPRVRKNTEGLS